MTTRKILLSLSAFALTIHIAWEILRQTVWFWPWYNETIWGNPLRVELFWLPYTWLFLGAIILAATAFFIREPNSQTIPEWHKFSTYTLSGLALFVTGYAIINSVKVYGADYLYAPAWLRILMDIIGSAWLWSLVAHPVFPELPRTLRSIIGAGIWLVAILWGLQLTSGISYLTSGHILMFRSHAFGSWLRYLVPTLLLCSYSIFLLNKWPSIQLYRLHQTRNTHCTPGSFFERSYPAMRIASLIGIGLILVSIYLVKIWIDSFDIDYSLFAVISLMATTLITWILLNIIAFFQLPNPRGYRIFNWLCFVIFLIFFPLGLVLGIIVEHNAAEESIGIVSMFLGLIALASHLLVTAIRVILYTIPKRRKPFISNFMKSEGSADDRQDVCVEGNIAQIIEDNKDALAGITSAEKNYFVYEKQSETFHLQRFVDAQQHTYQNALEEIRKGRKIGHWIWFIFPQMKGLGRSYMSNDYGITSLDEARAYLAHPILGSRLIEMTEALLQHKEKTAFEILGSIDAIKVRSCMTLFDLVDPNSIFADTLAAFYNKERDELTLNLIKK